MVGISLPLFHWTQTTLFSPGWAQRQVRAVRGADPFGDVHARDWAVSILWLAHTHVGA